MLLRRLAPIVRIPYARPMLRAATLSTTSLESLLPAESRLRAEERAHELDDIAAQSVDDPSVLPHPDASRSEVTVAIPLEVAADLESSFVFPSTTPSSPTPSPSTIPPISLDALRFETRGSLTASPGGLASPADAKAVVRAKLADLGFDSEVEIKWAREILGPRYDWASQELRIVSRDRATSGENLRRCVELVAAVVAEARTLAAKHGDFEQRGPKTQRQSRNAVLRKRRRRPKPKHKRGLAF